MRLDCRWWTDRENWNNNTRQRIYNLAQGEQLEDEEYRDVVLFYIIIKKNQIKETAPRFDAVRVVLLFIQNKNDDLKNENERESRLTIRSRNLTSTSILLMNKQKLHFLFFFGYFPIPSSFGLNWKSKKESEKSRALHVTNETRCWIVSFGNGGLSSTMAPKRERRRVRKCVEKRRNEKFGQSNEISLRSVENCWAMIYYESMDFAVVFFLFFFFRLVRGKIEIG